MGKKEDMEKLVQAENVVKAAEDALAETIEGIFTPGRRVEANVAGRVNKYTVREVNRFVLILDTGKGKTLSRAYSSVNLLEDGE